MNLMKRYSPSGYYGRDNVLLCTCGHSENVERYSDIESCPSCGTRYIRSLNDKHNHSFTKLNVEDYNLKGTKTIINTKIVKEKDSYKLIKESEEIYEISFNFIEKHLEIKLNGNVINNNKTNMTKAFSRFSIEWYDSRGNADFKYNLFNSYASFFRTESLLETYKNILQYPQLEVLYTTYGSLEPFKGINIKEFNAASKPSDILGLSKPVLKKYFEIIKEDSRISDYFKTDIVAIKAFDAQNKNKPDYVCSILNAIHGLGIYKQIKDYFYLLSLGYEYQKLYSYLEDDIFTYQGISSPSDGIELLVDYVRMSKDMNVDFEKYPKSLKLYHDLASKNYKLVSTPEEIEQFKQRIQETDYKSLEYSDNSEEYIVINPSEVTDIVNEGRHLNHCVASYIKKVIKGETKITFMRNKKNPDKSLITLEVENGVLKQYKGFANRYPNQSEMKFIEKWLKVKNIKK